MSTSAALNPFVADHSDASNDGKAPQMNGGGDIANTSAAHPTKARGSSLWDQWITQTGTLVILVRQLGYSDWSRVRLVWATTAAR